MGNKRKFTNLLDYEYIRSAILNYGFCATIEVSNGSYRKKKKKQVGMSKDFLSALTSNMGRGELSVMQGLAIVKRSSALRQDIDFMIAVGQLDNSILRGVGFDALNGQYLCIPAKRNLEKLLQISEKQNKSLYYLVSADKSNYYGEVKGVLLELYVKKLLDMSFGNSWRRIFSRVEFYGEARQLGEADIVVVSEEQNFRTVLDRLKCLDHIKVY